MEIVETIDKFYARNSRPDELAALQKQLQKFQRDASSLQFADKVLQSPKSYSQNCQFFSALIYTTQLHQALGATVIEEDPMDEDEDKLLQALEISRRMLGHLELQTRIYEQGGGNMFIVRKMLANIAYLYSRVYLTWKDPMQDLVQIFTEAAASSGTQVVFLLLFSQVLVEDVLKDSTANSTFDKELCAALRQYVWPRTSDLVLRNTTPDSIQPSVQCFGAWCSYISYSQFQTLEKFEIAPLCEAFLAYLVSVDDFEDPVIGTIVELFTSLFETNANLVSPQLKDTMFDFTFGTWNRSYLQHCFETEDFGAVSEFASLLIAFIEYDMMQIPRFMSRGEDRVMELIIALTGCSGVPVLEEDISKKFIEFWLELSDYLTADTAVLSAVFRDESSMSAFHSSFESILLQIVKIYLQKIQYPLHDAQTTAQLSKNSEFLGYRVDVAELLEIVLPTLGDKLLNLLFDQILAQCSGNEQNLEVVESCAYALTAIAGELSSDLNALYQKQMKLLLTQTQFLDICRLTGGILTQTCIRLLGESSFLYHKEPQILFEVLGVLFQLVESKNDPKFERNSGLAAKAAALICKECRNELSESVTQFDTILAAALLERSLESYIRVELVNSVGFIIQGMGNLEEQAHHTFKTLQFIYEKYTAVILELKNCTSVQESLVLAKYIASLTKCVEALSESLQLPDDPENLFDNEQQQQRVDDFWRKDELNIHGLILQLLAPTCFQDPELMKILSQLNDDGVNVLETCFETCCNSIKAGLREEICGPFVIGASQILQFFQESLNTLIVSQGASTGRVMNVVHLLETVNVFTSSKLKQIGGLKPMYLKLLSSLTGSEYLRDLDVFVAYNTVMANILSSKPEIFFEWDGSQTMIKLNLTVLGTFKEKMTIQSSVKLWSQLITMRKGTMSDHENLKRMMQVEGLGLLLSNSLMTGMLSSTRGNVELYAELFRVLWGKFSQDFENWLVQVVSKMNKNRPNNPLDIDGFIKKIKLSRADRKTVQAVKQFWVTSNGLMNI